MTDDAPDLPRSNGWPEYSRLVLKTLDRLNERDEATRRDLAALGTEVAMLKVKAAAWGAVAGMVVAAVVAAIMRALLTGHP